MKLTELHNKIWKEGKLPKVWKEAVVIPVSKPGKYSTTPSSYRPIVLTSNLSKIMERMISETLIYTPEERELLVNYQSGFRKG